MSSTLYIFLLARYNLARATFDKIKNKCDDINVMILEKVAVSAD
jgi:hypothetical protein